MNLRFSENALPRALKCFEVERDHHDDSFSKCLKNLMRWVSRYEGDKPVFISEYGGIGWNPDGAGWGYGNGPKTETEFIEA